MAAEPVFIDTNVLVAASVAAHPSHGVASAYLARLEANGAPACINGQVCREFLVVLTRQPVEGRAFSTDEALVAQAPRDVQRGGLRAVRGRDRARSAGLVAPRPSRLDHVVQRAVRRSKMERTGCSRVVCPGFHNSERDWNQDWERACRRKYARAQRRGPAPRERRSSRRAGCHHPDPLPLDHTESEGVGLLAP